MKTAVGAAGRTIRTVCRSKVTGHGEEAVCTWQPQPNHTSGPPHILNGGIIAVLMDCHCICTAVAAAYRAEGAR